MAVHGFYRRYWKYCYKLTYRHEKGTFCVANHLLKVKLYSENMEYSGKFEGSGRNVSFQSGTTGMPSQPTSFTLPPPPPK